MEWWIDVHAELALQPPDVERAPPEIARVGKSRPGSALRTLSPSRFANAIL
jgi:hypothetical protein